MAGAYNTSCCYLLMTNEMLIQSRSRAAKLILAHLQCT
jgi:hypothetical protein